MSSKTHLFQRKSSGIYYARTRVNGRVVWRSTGTRDRAEAVAFLVERGSSLSAPAVTLSLFISRISERLEGRVRPKTLGITISSLKHLLRVAGDKELTELTADDIVNFVDVLRQDYAPTSINIFLRSIRASLRRAVRYGYIKSVPDIELLRTGRKQPKFLTREQFGLLLEQVRSADVQDAFRVAVNTGLRLGELVSLKWEHVDLENRKLTVADTETFTAKTVTSRRVVPLNDEALSILSKRRKQLSTDLVFPVSASHLTHTFTRAARRAGLDVPFHSLRHTFASWLLQAGTPSFIVSELLGHGDVKLLTSTYGHLEDSHLLDGVQRLNSEPK